MDFLLYYEPDATLALRGIGILFGCLSIILTQLGPKIYAIRNEKIESLKPNSNSIEMAVDNRKNDIGQRPQFNNFVYNGDNMPAKRAAAYRDDSGYNNNYNNSYLSIV